MSFKDVFREEMQGAIDDYRRDLNRQFPATSSPIKPLTRLRRIKIKWFWFKYGVRERLAQWIDPSA